MSSDAANGALIASNKVYLPFFGQTLHGLGARKFALVGLGLLGCTPSARSSSGTNGSTCVDRFNNAARQFNERLRSTVESLNIQQPDSKYIFVNTTAIQLANQAGKNISLSHRLNNNNNN